MLHFFEAPFFMSSQKEIVKEFKVKNMVCKCCIKILGMELPKRGFEPVKMQLGRIWLKYNPDNFNEEKLEKALEEIGFDMVKDRELVLLEQIKQSVIELIHYLNNQDSIIRKSDYLVEKMSMSYQSITKLFSKYEKITLERFIILHKIERIKELIDSDEYTLSEIAYMMDYSSVQYLSSQFKQITGITVSQYKNSDNKIRRDLHSIC